MNKYHLIFLICFLADNLLAVIITCHDKRCAMKHKWRVKESTLLLISAIGGSVGMFITMLIIRHKTKHPKFMIGIPLIMLLQIILILFLVKTYGL